MEEVTNWSLEGSLQSFHPSGATTSDMYVFEKTTVEKAPQALPSHTFPVPRMVQFTNENPVSSFIDCLPCAVIEPLTPSKSGFAIECMVQPWCHK